MSHQALSWAWGQDLPGNEKFVLVALADASNAEGLCIYGQRKVAEMVGTSDRSVRENMRRLEERGLLSRSQRRRENGSRTSDETQLALGQQAEESSGNQPEAERASQRKPASGLVPCEVPKASSSSSAGTLDLDDGVPVEMRADAAGQLATKAKVAGRLVTAVEMGIAVAALAEYNRQAGADYGIGGQLVAIVGRIRERPSYDAGAHVRLVQSAWRIKWWERNGRGRRPTPAVIYGNAGVFEQVVQDATDERAGKAPDVGEQAMRYTRED